MALRPLRETLHARRRRREYRQVLRRLAGPKLLLALARDHPRAYFIEVGANDGEKLDHLHRIILSSEWRGLMVEPVPYVFERLRRNYEGLGRIAFENAAIWNRDGTAPFYHLAPVTDRRAEGLPEWYDAIGSFSRDFVLSHQREIPDIEQRLVCTEVPCFTLESLLIRHGVGETDVLQIDAEGYDIEIVRQLDLDQNRPRVLIYEHYHLDSVEQQVVLRRLRRSGYEVKEEGMDTWALDTHAEPALAEWWRPIQPGVPPVRAAEERA
jgi:FkbM family methyltransferase